MEVVVVAKTGSKNPATRLSTPKKRRKIGKEKIKQLNVAKHTQN
jgi:hypothetical protein